MSIPSRWFVASTASLVCLTLLAYAPALRGPQLFDDPFAIQANATITRLWPISGPLHPPPGTPVSGRPVVNYSLALNYWLNGLVGIDQSSDPGGPHKTISYHGLNLLIHVASGLLLLGIVRQTLREGRVGARWKESADLFALAAAGTWLLHPMQTEAVDYIVQRTELIVSFFYLATLYCSIRAWNGRPLCWYSLGILACLLGMGSKELMVSAPLMIVLYDRAFKVDSWRKLFTAHPDRTWFYGGLGATTMLLIAELASAPRGSTVGFSALPWYEYLHTQGWAIAHYLRLAVLPTALSLDYDYHVVAHWRGLFGLLFLSALGVVTVVAWIRVNRCGWLAFLGAWFFLILAPSSSVVPVLTELVAERRMYLPLAAVLVLLAVGTGVVAQRLRQPKWLTAVGVATALALAVTTAHRSTLYGDAEAIWRDATIKQPNDPRAWNNLANVVANKSVWRNIEAESMYRTALALDPGYADALLNLAVSEFKNRERDSAEVHFRQMLAFDSVNHVALGGLGSLLLNKGDTAAALPLMERFAHGQTSSEYRTMLGQIYLSKGRVGEAISAFRDAIVAAPARTDLMVFLANVLIEQKRADQAEPYLQEAVRRDPDSAVDLALLSLACADIGHAAEAIQRAQQAFQRAGNDERVYFFAGRAMEDAHRDDLAEGYLGHATKLSPGDADALTELGKVEADLGKKGAAIALFDRALRLAPRDEGARAGLAKLRSPGGLNDRI